MENLPSKNSSPIVAWVLMGLAILYDISPVDIIPDIPVVGWIDDFFVTATATFNLVQKTCQDSVQWLATIAKTLKWLTIIVGIIAILLVVMLGAAIVKLFT